MMYLIHGQRLFSINRADHDSASCPIFRIDWEVNSIPPSQMGHSLGLCIKLELNSRP
jgi:hypothetical protein